MINSKALTMLLCGMLSIGADAAVMHMHMHKDTHHSASTAIYPTPASTTPIFASSSFDGPFPPASSGFSSSFGGPFPTAPAGFTSVGGAFPTASTGSAYPTASTGSASSVFTVFPSTVTSGSVRPTTASFSSCAPIHTVTVTLGFPVASGSYSPTAVYPTNIPSASASDSGPDNIPSASASDTAPTSITSASAPDV